MSRSSVFVALAAIVSMTAADHGCGTCLTGAKANITYAGLSANIYLWGEGCPGTCPITLRYDLDWCVTKVATVAGGYVISQRDPFLYEFNFTTSPVTGNCKVALQDSVSSSVSLGTGQATFTDADGGQLVITTHVPKCNNPPPTTGAPPPVTTAADPPPATTGEVVPSTTAASTTGPSCVACGDPHFQGLNGHKFEFQGAANKTFAIISDPLVQLNSRFIPARFRHTFLGETCLRVCDDIVTLAPTATVLVNGKPLSTGRQYSREGRLTVQRTSKHEVEIEIPNRWSLHFRVAAHVDILKAQPHFAWDERTHGVLGHTLKPMDPEARTERCNPRLQGGCDVEGDWKDYEIESNICSTKWLHSMFDAAACL